MDDIRNNHNNRGGISLRLLFLICLLIGAIFYRYPVQIQKFSREARTCIYSLVEKVKTLRSDSGAKPADEKNRKAQTEIVIITLKNNREIKGIIERENEEALIVDIGIGTVRLSRSEIISIKTASGKEKERVFAEWEKHQDDGSAIGEITEIKYASEDRIIARVIFNDKVRTNLILDTGAPYVVITPEIAKRLIVLDKAVTKTIAMKWTDGSTGTGKLVLFDSVQIGNARVKNVEVVISEIPILDSDTHGLLGMSFLKYFQISIDTGTRRVILKRRR